MDVISRGAAKAAGRVRYFTGRPCKWGHIAERIVSSGRCVECNREFQRERRAQNPELARAQWRAWAARNPDKLQGAARLRVKWKDMTPEQRERQRLRVKQWRERNPEKVRGYKRDDS